MVSLTFVSFSLFNCLYSSLFVAFPFFTKDIDIVISSIDISNIELLSILDQVSLCIVSPSASKVINLCWLQTSTNLQSEFSD